MNVCQHIGRQRLRLSRGTLADRSRLHFLILVDEQRCVSIELVRDIEQMLDGLVRRHARQQHAPDAQVSLGTVLFGNEGIRCLLDPIVKEFVGVLATEDEPCVDGFPECRVISSSVIR